MLTWPEHVSARLRVERVEPPHAFTFRWVRRTGAEPDAGNSTRVEFTLTAEDGGTRLRVVETGFGELDAKENTHGWGVELDELQAYVSTLAHR